MSTSPTQLESARSGVPESVVISIFSCVPLILKFDLERESSEGDHDFPLVDFFSPSSSHTMYRCPTALGKTELAVWASAKAVDLLKLPTGEKNATFFHRNIRSQDNKAVYTISTWEKKLPELRQRAIAPPVIEEPQKPAISGLQLSFIVFAQSAIPTHHNRGRWQAFHRAAQGPWHPVYRSDSGPQWEEEALRGSHRQPEEL